jgi:hypothetical protein
MAGDKGSGSAPATKLLQLLRLPGDDFASFRASVMEALPEVVLAMARDYRGNLESCDRAVSELRARFTQLAASESDVANLASVLATFDGVEVVNARHRGALAAIEAIITVIQVHPPDWRERIERIARTDTDDGSDV